MTHAADRHPRDKIVWLVGVHMAVEVVVMFATDASYRHAFTTAGIAFRHSVTVFRWLQAAFLGIVFAQTTLLAVCAVLGMSRGWKRLYWLSGGIVCILLLLNFGHVRPSDQIGTTVVLSTVLAVTILFIPRTFGLRIQLGESAAAQDRRVRFSLRQLMIATLFVGCLAGVWRALPPDAFDAWRPIEVTPVAAVIVWPGMVPVWPALAAKHPLLYTIASLVLVSSIAYDVERIVANNAPAFITVGITVDVMVVATSLLVVRSWGYRLTRVKPILPSTSGFTEKNGRQLPSRRPSR